MKQPLPCEGKTLHGNQGALPCCAECPHKQADNTCGILLRHRLHGHRLFRCMGTGKNGLPCRRKILTSYGWCHQHQPA